MVKWKQQYMDWLNKAPNEEILDEYTNLSGGDGYDGSMSPQGDWKYTKVTKEFNQRLIKCGFLTTDKKA